MKIVYFCNLHILHNTPHVHIQWSWSDTINDLFLDISELSNHVCPVWWWCLSAVSRQQELPTVQMPRPVSILYSCRYRGNGNCEPVYSTDLLYFAVRLQHNRKLAGGWAGIEPKQRTQNLILSREQPAWKLKKDWPCCICVSVTINTEGRRHPRLCFVFPPPPPYFK